jgi:hypothetical protein
MTAQTATVSLSTDRRVGRTLGAAVVATLASAVVLSATPSSAAEDPGYGSANAVEHQTVSSDHPGYGSANALERRMGLV